MRSSSGGFGIQDECDRLRELLPLAHLAHELLSTEGGEIVETRLAIVRRGAPRRPDPLPRLEALERRVERAVVHKERLSRSTLNGTGDALPVLRATEQRAQDDEVEGALQEGDAIAAAIWRSRSEEGRVGKECRSGWNETHQK